VYAVVSYTIAGSVGFNAPAAATAQGGVDQFANATRAFTSDNQYATDAVAGHRQRYANFGFLVPPTATIVGIEVTAEAKSSDSSGCELDIDLAPNGTTFTANDVAGLGSSDQVLVFGGSTNTWGRTWTPAEINSTNFTARLENVDPGFSCTNNSTLSVDQVQTKVYYTIPGSATVQSQTIGGYTAWIANTGTSVAAVSTNDSDTTYVSNSAAGAVTQTYAFPDATVPANASNIRVTVHAIAKETAGSNGAIQLVAENSITQAVDVGHNLSSNYTDYTWTMSSNPLGGAWTVAEVNNWTTHFGVLNTSSGGTVPRVTHLYAVVSWSIVTDPVAQAYSAADAAKASGTTIFTIHYGATAGRA
jgi:hypothetical protein